MTVGSYASGSMNSKKIMATDPNTCNLYRYYYVKSLFVFLPVPVCGSDYDALPWYRKAWEWICGIEKMRGDEPQMTDAEMRALEEKQTSIHEDTFWRRFLNFNAVFLMTLGAFVWGFFA